MTTDNYIFSYYQRIKEGTIAAGKWITLFYDYLIKGLEQKAFFYDHKKAIGAVEWIESHCYHTEGPLAPGPFCLELWQKAFISAIFGIVDGDGLRIAREVVLLVARKQGKSQMAAAISKYLWLSGEGGFGVKIFTIAPKLEQADIIYNNIWQQVVVDPEFKAMQERHEELRKIRHTANARANSFIAEMPRHRQSDLYLPATNGTVKKIAFSAKKSDGFNPSLCICDEIASWEGDQGLKQYEVLKSGMGARPEGLLLSCTTSGYINDSIFDELMKRSTRFLLGDSNEKRLFPFLYMIDDPEKWDDITELQKSNPNLNVSVPVSYMLEEIEIARGSLSKKSEFLTKYCCIKQNSSAAFLRALDIEKASGEHLALDDFRDSYACAGVDLSSTVDLSAVIVTVERDNVINVFGQFFMPSERVEEATARDGLPYMQYVKRGLLTLSGENFIDYHDIYNYLVALVEKYHIYPLKVGYDRYSAQYLIQDLTAYGFNCDDVYQGDNLWPIIQEFEGLIKDKKINIGDNDLLKIHLLNTAVKMNNDRGRGRICKITANAHIDGTAALLDGLTVRAKFYNEIGEQLKNGAS